jgi:cellobiose phosphorylase
MRFIPVCERMGDSEKAEKYKSVAAEIVDSIEENAWDGNWYMRAFFDDGTPLGSSKNSECTIDSLAQSWAAITGAGRKERVEEALNSVEKYLIDNETGIIKLLTPPFDKSDLHPGYIKSYLPGVRENGGQYTHASTWVVMAFAKMGMGDRAVELFNMINPINHTRTKTECQRYKTEPYVMSADVYAVDPNAGRGGWSWYTGAAGWMYRVGIEHILGIKKQNGLLVIDPCIPSTWDGYKVKIREGQSLYTINISNPQKVCRGVKEISVDGANHGVEPIQLIDDGKNHTIEVLLERAENEA